MFSRVFALFSNEPEVMRYISLWPVAIFTFFTRLLFFIWQCGCSYCRTCAEAPWTTSYCFRKVLFLDLSKHPLWGGFSLLSSLNCLFCLGHFPEFLVHKDLLAFQKRLIMASLTDVLTFIPLPLFSRAYFHASFLPEISASTFPALSVMLAAGYTAVNSTDMVSNQLSSWHFHSLIYYETPSGGVKMSSTPSLPSRIKSSDEENRPIKQNRHTTWCVSHKVSEDSEREEWNLTREVREVFEKKRLSDQVFFKILNWGIIDI